MVWVSLLTQQILNWGFRPTKGKKVFLASDPLAQAGVNKANQRIPRVETIYQLMLGWAEGAMFTQPIRPDSARLWISCPFDLSIVIRSLASLITWVSHWWKFSIHMHQDKWMVQTPQNRSLGMCNSYSSGGPRCTVTCVGNSQSLVRAHWLAVGKPRDRKNSQILFE